MAKQIRTASADESMAAIVDRGSEVNTLMNNLQVEDKGIKGKIVANISMEPGETTVGLRGNKATAIVTRRVSYSIEFADDAEEIEFQTTFEKGDLCGIATRTIKIEHTANVKLDVIAAALAPLGLIVTANYGLVNKAVEGATGIAKKVAKEKIVNAVKYEE